MKVAVWIVASCLFAGFASVGARDLDGHYAQSPFHDWYERQRNGHGTICCHESDAHAYYGDYALNADGSVTLAGGVHIPAFKVLTDGNPTGHPVWWYFEGEGGMRSSVCFAPGSTG